MTTNAATTAVSIGGFNTLDDAAANALLAPCVAIPSWAAHLVAGRPFASVDELLDAARAHALGWTAAEVDAALADHPRIGERPATSGTSAAMSRGEQSGVDASDLALAERLRAGNLAYEAKFGRIYLVRAAGRTGAEMAALLEQRLANDPVTEAAVTKGQLGEIALLRLAGLFGENPA